MGTLIPCATTNQSTAYHARTYGATRFDALASNHSLGVRPPILIFTSPISVSFGRVNPLGKYLIVADPNLISLQPINP